MSDYEMPLQSWPVHTKYWPDEAMYQGLDPGIRFAVRILHARGYETCQSCEGGPGHAYDHPTVDMIAGEDAAGFAAVATLVSAGIEVDTVAQSWRIDALGRPVESVWRIVLKRGYPERADDWLMFKWGYQAQPDPCAGGSGTAEDTE